jgi:SAM-dependent methyltransferase
VQFLEDDVQTADLPGPFDAMISRFGVMFFSDTPAAFRNIAAAMVPGGRMVMAAWAEARDNPYFMEAAAAARAVLGDLPKADRSAPGPFAFEDRDRVRRDLGAAGLRDLSVEKQDVLLAPSGTLEEFATLLQQIGPAAGAAAAMEASEAQQGAIAEELHRRFAQFETPDGLRVPASINLITARV